MTSRLDALDNPVWDALHTGHAAVAEGDDRLRRYPADMGPFAAVAADGERPSPTTLAQVVRPGEHVYFVGRTPFLPSPWAVEHCPPILQMIFPEPSPASAPAPSTSAIVLRELGDADVPAMLALTALVYPEYFREKTRELGRYIGVFDGGHLVAMGGERFLLARHVELSAICTHPSYLGRGFARTIIANLVASVRGRGLTPFLHLSIENAPASSLYRSCGFVEHAELPMVKVRRPPDS
jgi:GNAT superfamily N-acetyltransferase